MKMGLRRKPKNNKQDKSSEELAKYKISSLWSGILIGFIILCFASLISCYLLPEVIYGWIAFALIVTLMLAGYGSFELNLAGIKVAVKHVEELKKDIDYSLAFFVPMILSTAYSTDPNSQAIINRLGSRQYIYNLMHKILSNFNIEEESRCCGLTL